MVVPEADRYARRFSLDTKGGRGYIGRAWRMRGVRATAAGVGRDSPVFAPDSGCRGVTLCSRWQCSEQQGHWGLLENRPSRRFVACFREERSAWRVSASEQISEEVTIERLPRLRKGAFDFFEAHFQVGAGKNSLSEVN